MISTDVDVQSDRIGFIYFVVAYIYDLGVKQDFIAT